MVSQKYNIYGDQGGDIIRGNSAILKCKIPSFVADYLDVIAWDDGSGNTYSFEANKIDIGSFLILMFAKMKRRTIL